MIKKRKRTAWAMAIIMLLLAFSPLNATLGSTPTSLDAEVVVKGIGAGGTIDGSESIGIKVTFAVPVQGDGFGDYFKHGDEVTLLLSESFHFDPIPSTPIELYFDAKKLGTVVLGNNSSDQAIATIIFNGDEDVFDPEMIEDGEQPMPV